MDAKTQEIGRQIGVSRDIHSQEPFALPKTGGFQSLNFATTKIDAKEICRLMELMGLKPENVHFRFISKLTVDRAIATGTDRDSSSTLHSSYGRTNYEQAAMRDCGVLDNTYTAYLSDGASLKSPEASYLLDLSTTAILIYRKDPAIIAVNAFQYLPPGERPESFGFHIFRRHPMELFAGVISERGAYCHSGTQREG